MAHKKATTTYDAESKKPEGEKKLSAKQVNVPVYVEYEAEIHQRKSSEKWLLVELVHRH
jgi:hypothetical protein